MMRILPNLFRYLVGCVLTIFSLLIVFYGIIAGVSTFWTFVPWYMALILFFLDVSFLGVLEGLHVSVVELARHNAERFRNSHPRAYDVWCLVNSKLISTRF